MNPLDAYNEWDAEQKAATSRESLTRRAIQHSNHHDIMSTTPAQAAFEAFHGDAIEPRDWGKCEFKAEWHRAAQAAISVHQGSALAPEVRERPPAHPEAAQERETPETDSKTFSGQADWAEDNAMSFDCVTAEFARSLERQRNQLQKKLNEIRKVLTNPTDAV